MSSAKRILVIAGSDSSGGAGLEADQKVIAAHGCYAMTATTALTAQNTQGVEDIHEIPSTFVQKQIDACATDIGIDVVKTGMLAQASTISVVAESLKKYKVSFSVVDPVMVATSGARLLAENAIQTLCDQLLPISSIVTPNIPEALLILKEKGKEYGEIEDLESLKRLALVVSELGPKHVLIKGGHCPLDKDRRVTNDKSKMTYVVNVLYSEGSYSVFEGPYQQSRNTHGTGCSLASAIACNVASGMDVRQAVRDATRYVEAGIRMSVDLGKGSGPINHFHSLKQMPFPPEQFIDYVLELPEVQPVWKKFTHHEFVEGLGDGTLPLECFKFYMIQDYLYLTQFARANALAAYKAQDLDGVAASAEIVMHIHTETLLHVKECEQLGITRQEMERVDEHQACTAYSRWILDVGQSQDWLALQIAMLPCLLGYHMIGHRLHSIQDPKAPENANRYKSWIENYVAEDYTDAVRKGRALIEKHVKKQSPERIGELVKIFARATTMEAGFWDMAMSAAGR